MSNLSQLSSLEQIAAQRERLERRAQAQAEAVGKDIQSVRQVWQQRFAQVRRLSNIVSCLMPKINRAALLVSIFAPLLRPFMRRAKKR